MMVSLQREPWQQFVERMENGDKTLEMWSAGALLKVVMTLMEAMVRGGVYYCHHLVLTTDYEIGLCLHSSKLCSCAMYIYTISMPIHVYLVHCDFLSVFIPLSCNYAPHTISMPV